MKATRKTIPTLVEKRERFENGSGTMRGLIPTRPLMQSIISNPENQLDDTEKSRLRIDAGPNFDGIVYVIMSYHTPIAWETRKGEVYKVTQKFSQTTSKHTGLLYLFHKR